ncbi:MAG TPA: hypothetical protein VFB22_15925 [Candidatus Baltobacteraceae bacterium]|nr:hypothetical protein [Candidatus Baltobacteraceae bacterium]
MHTSGTINEPSVALSIATFLDELTAVLPALVPEARIVRGEGRLFFRRGVASAELTAYEPGTLVLRMRQRGDVVLSAVVPSTARGLNDLAADLVGYFCGAPLVTLALFPHRGERARLPVSRRRRRAHQDAPLIRVTADDRCESRPLPEAFPGRH